MEMVAKITLAAGAVAITMTKILLPTLCAACVEVDRRATILQLLPPTLADMVASIITTSLPRIVAISMMTTSLPPNCVAYVVAVRCRATSSVPRMRSCATIQGLMRKGISSQLKRVYLKVLGVLANLTNKNAMTVLALIQAGVNLVHAKRTRQVAMCNHMIHMATVMEAQISASVGQSTMHPDVHVIANMKRSV
jgi:hypothetical protein